MNKNASSSKRGVIRRALRLVNPLSPVRSFKETVGSGASTIRDLHAQVNSMARGSSRNETFEEAMARRPADALPLDEIEKTNLNSKRIALFFSLLSFAYSLGSMIPENYLGGLLGILFSAFSFLVALKHSHRVWQVRHRNLISFKEFTRRPGWLKQTLDPEIFN